MQANPPALVVARGLTRSFRTFDRRPGLLGAVRDLFHLGGTAQVALDRLDLDVHAGEIIGIIGPNGAGKSTTVKLLTGILRPTAGTLSVAGRTPYLQRREHVRDIGVVFGQRTQLWWDLAVVEALELLAAVFGVTQADYRTRLQRFEDVLEIGPLLHKPVRELSLGQRMRCDLAAALLHRPSLLFLDEPTIGLDVAVKLRIRQFISEINQVDGTTVVLTSHDLADVEAVCPRIVLLDAGQKLFDGSADALKETLGGRRRLVLELDRAIDSTEASNLCDGLPIEGIGPGSDLEIGRLVLIFSAQTTHAPSLIQSVLSRTSVADLRVLEPAIETVVAQFYEARDDGDRSAGSAP